MKNFKYNLQLFAELNTNLTTSSGLTDEIATNNVEYDELGGADKIKLYNTFFDIATQIMLEVKGIPEEEFLKLSDYEQSSQVADFVFSDDFSIALVDEENEKEETEVL